MLIFATLRFCGTLFVGYFHGQRNLVGYSPWDRKESDTTERLHFTSLQFDQNLSAHIFTN